MSFKKFGVIVCDGSLDCSLGFLSAWLIASTMGMELNGWFLLFGGLGAYAPDIDGLPHFLKPGKNKLEQLYLHRSGVHYPLLFLPVIFCLTFFLIQFAGFENPFVYSLSLTLAAFFHLVHDTFLHGWGIAWLYPFSEKRLTLFAHSRYPKGLPAVFILAPSEVQKIREDHYDAKWQQFWQRPVHPFWYCFAFIHTLGLLILLTQI